MGGLEQAGSPTLTYTSPRTTLAHVAVGETREVVGQGEVCDSWVPACPARSPTTPEEGEAERVSECRRRAPYLTKVSSVLRRKLAAY